MPGTPSTGKRFSWNAQLTYSQQKFIKTIQVTFLALRELAARRPLQLCNVSNFTDMHMAVWLDRQNRRRCRNRINLQVCSETRALRETDISWFRHVASEKRACSLGMRCVTLAARDSCAIFVSLAHRPVPPQRRRLSWTKWEKTASLRARDVLWY